MEPFSILDRFLQLTSAGIDLRAALHFVIADTSNEVDAKVASGQSVETALKQTGFNAASAVKLASMLPAPLVAQSVATAIRVVVGGGGIAGIPTAECLAKHLPRDREPTREEFEEAWKTCRKNQ